MTKVGNADNPEIDRRAAIKKGVVGATAAGLIWSGPKIERLTLRPLYAAAQTGPPQLIVVMSGANEVPPNMSAATGTATLTLDAFAGTVQVVYSNITGFTPTAAHIHGPAVAGSNAGVFIDFMGFGDTTVTPGTAAVNQLLAFTSLYYVNVHSAAFPGGEIRGQLI